MLDFEASPLAALLLTDLEYFPTILEHAQQDRDHHCYGDCDNNNNNNNDNDNHNDNDNERSAAADTVARTHPGPEGRGQGHGQASHGPWDAWILFYLEADGILQDLRCYLCRTGEQAGADEAKLIQKFNRLMSAFNVTRFSSESAHRDKAEPGAISTSASALPLPFPATVVSAVRRLMRSKVPMVSVLSTLVATLAESIILKCSQWIDRIRQNIPVAPSVVVGHSAPQPPPSFPSPVWLRARQFATKGVRLELVVVLRQPLYRVYLQHYLIHRNFTTSASARTSRRASGRLRGHNLADVAAVFAWMDVRQTLDELQQIDICGTTTAAAGTVTGSTLVEGLGTTGSVNITSVSSITNVTTLDAVDRALRQRQLQRTHQYAATSHLHHLDTAIGEQHAHVLAQGSIDHTGSLPSEPSVSNEAAYLMFSLLLRSVRECHRCYGGSYSSHSHAHSSSHHHSHSRFEDGSQMQSLCEVSADQLAADIAERLSSTPLNTATRSTAFVDVSAGLSVAQLFTESVRSQSSRSVPLNVSGLSEQVRLDLCAVVSLCASIRLNVESIKSLDFDFVLQQSLRMQKLLRILERDLFHFLQVAFASFVEKSFEYVQLAAFVKSRDSEWLKGKRMLSEFLERRVIPSDSGVVPWCDPSAGNTTFVNLNAVDASTVDCKETLGQLFDVGKESSMESSESKSDAYESDNNDANDSNRINHALAAILGDMSTRQLLQVVMLAVVGRPMLLVHRSKDMLKAIGDAIPILAEPFKIIMKINAPVIETQELLKEALLSESDVSRVHLVVSSLWPAIDAAPVITGNNRPAIIVDLDSERLLGPHIHTAAVDRMFKELNSAAFLALQRGIQRVLVIKSTDIYNSNVMIRQLFARYWRDAVLRFLPTNMLYFPSHRVVACDVERLLTRMFVDKAKGPCAGSLTMRQMSLRSLRSDNDHTFSHVNSPQQATVQSAIDAIRTKTNAFDDVETWFCAELLGYSLPSAVDLYRRVGSAVADLRL